MEKNQKSVLMMSMIIACFMLVAVIGVGYAAFSVGLNINGTGKVASSNWNVHFENLSEPIVFSKNAAKVTAEQLKAPQLADNTTSVKGFEVQLQTPGDSVSYTFDVVNTGTFNAKISDFQKKNPKCTGFEGATTATQDALNVCNHLTYKLTYNGTNTEVAVGDTLNKDERKTLKLTITYEDFTSTDPSGAELPKEDVTISDLDILINYAQVQNS